MFHFGFRYRETHSPNGNCLSHLPAFSPHPSCFCFASKPHPAAYHIATATLLKKRCSVQALRSPAARAGIGILWWWFYLNLSTRAQPQYLWGKDVSLSQASLVVPERLFLLTPSPLFWELLRSSVPDDGLIGQVPDLSTRPRSRPPHCPEPLTTRPGLPTTHSHWGHHPLARTSFHLPQEQFPEYQRGWGAILAHVAVSMLYAS